MNVVFAAHGPNHFKAPNIWLMRILPYLKRQGITPRVLFVMLQPGPCRVVEMLQSMGIDCEVVPFTYTEDTLLQILTILRRNPPDVFVPNLNPTSYFATPWLKQAGIPSVGVLRSTDTFHDEVFEEFVVGQEAFRVNAVACKSEYLAKQVRGALPATPVLCSPSGAPVPEQTASYSRSPFQIVYSGRLIVKQKRIYELLGALSKVVSSHTNTECVLYGDGPERENVVKQLAEPHLNGKIRYGGFLQAHEIQPALLQAQAFILLSDYEGLSTSLVEAMACGLVPIVYQTKSGIEEIIKHGYNGFIVQNRDTDVLKAVETMSSSETRWHELSINARQTVIERFSTEKCAERWVHFLREVNHMHPNRSPIHVPAENELGLPPKRTAADGIGREDRRRLNSAPQQMCSPAPSSDASLAPFLNPELSIGNLDRHYIRTAILSALKSALPHFHGTFLDIGCGVMPYRSILTAPPSKIEKYLGMDIESEIYRAEVDIRWNGEHIPLENDSIDSAMATEVLEHCPNPVQVLREVKRVLRPGGVFFFTVPFLWPVHDAPYDYYRYTSFSLRRSFEEAGFAELNIQAMGGWCASLAQMIGLWVRRAPIDERMKEEWGQQLFPLYRALIEEDTIPDPWLSDNMVTGWHGLARTAIA